MIKFFTRVDDILGTSIQITLLGIFSIILLKIILKAKSFIQYGKLKIGKESVTSEATYHDRILNKQMLFASRKANIILAEQMEVISDKMGWLKDSNQYKFYKLILRAVVDDMLDILRDFFDENNLLTKTENDFLVLSKFIVTQAKDKVDEFFIPEFVGCSKEEMGAKCDEIVNVWVKHSRDIFEEAIRLAKRDQI